MTPEDILDAIGQIDETYVKKARAAKPRKVIFGLAAVAACLTLVLLMPFGISAGNESAENDVLRDQETGALQLESGSEECYGPSQDIAIETGPAGDCEYEPYNRAVIREYGSEIATCLGAELSAELREVLEQVKAESECKQAAVDLAQRGYLINMKDDGGTVTEYLLQDNRLYDLTNSRHYILDEANLKLLLEAMGVD